MLQVSSTEGVDCSRLRLTPADNPLSSRVNQLVDAVRSQIRLACSRHGEGTLSRILGMLDTEASSTPALVRCGTRLVDSFSEP